jgi:F1F0 ATPase subunit 2
MLQAIHYLLIFATGMALGALYFAGLWHTLRRLPDTGRPGISLLWSYLLRVSVVMAGFGLVANGRWEHWVAVLGGFILAREILVRCLGRNRA